MARRRYVQINGELVEITDENQPTPRMANAQGVLWNDRAYQDMGDPRFSSRTQHREFMKQHNLTTVDDFKGTWRDSEKQRIAQRQGQDVGSRRRDVVEAVRKLQSGYKPNVRREE